MSIGDKCTLRYLQLHDTENLCVFMFISVRGNYFVSSLRHKKPCYCFFLTISQPEHPKRKDKPERSHSQSMILGNFWSDYFSSMDFQRLFQTFRLTCSICRLTFVYLSFISQLEIIMLLLQGYFLGKFMATCEKP